MLNALNYFSSSNQHRIGRWHLVEAVPNHDDRLDDSAACKLSANAATSLAQGAIAVCKSRCGPGTVTVWQLDSPDANSFAVDGANKRS
jgi:hypothetical protein